MKISFDMSSLSSTTVASSASSASSSSATSVRDTIISYARAILPSLPASFYDFVPFTLAAIMALLFTALLVLLVEDSDDVNPNAAASRLPNGPSSASFKPSGRSSKRIVGLAERDKDAESGGSSDDSDWEPSPWDPRADLDPSSRRNLKQSQNWLTIQNEKIATSHGYRTTNKRLLASPPSSASPQSPAFNPPMLSMAKMIMHRHDQSSKRPRSSKTTSPPSSPPPTGTTTSFGSMQYTLKSAALRTDKLAIVAFPTTEPSTAANTEQSSSSNQPSPPQRSSPDDTERGKITRQQASAPHTRHARNRSVALPSISLPSLTSIPALVPSLPLLQSKSKSSSQDRSVRRSPSSLLEEGGSSSSNESLPIHSRKSSSERVPSISEDMEAIKSSERRPSEPLVELEKGHSTTTATTAR